MNGVTRYVLSCDGTRIAYDEVGDGDPVVLLHGWTDTRQSWVHAGYRTLLCEAGYRTILIDQRGHGQSDRPRDPARYSGALRIADLVAVLDALELRRVAVLGYSMGGVLALAAAAGIAPRIGSVVAIGAHPFAEDLSALRSVIAAGLEHWTALLGKALGGLDPIVRQRILDNDQHALAACVARDRTDFSSALAASGRPVLAVLGSADPRFLACRQLQSLRNVETVTLPGADHFSSFVAARQAMPTVLDFLSRHAVASGRELA